MQTLHVIVLPQRRKQIESEINRLGIEVKYWNGIKAYNTIHAVSLAHKQIIKFAKENNLPDVAIAEDDCEFTSLNSYKYFLDHKPDDFDIYLGGYYSGIKNPDNTLYSFSGLHLYICSARYYDQFLATPLNKNIDKGQAGFGKFICCDPLVAKQRNGYSFHRKSVVDDDHYLVGRTFLVDQL